MDISYWVSFLLLFLPLKYVNGGPPSIVTSAPTFEPTLNPTPNPTLNPTPNPTPNPTLNPTPNPTPNPMGSEVGKGCEEHAECSSGYCSPEKNTCYASPECKAIKQAVGATFHENRIILVLVGSGFTSLTDWESQVDTTYSIFPSFEFFEDANDSFHAFYVDKLEPSFCYYNCNGIQRLLCCDVAKAHSITADCFPPGSTVQTMVIHNDYEYGGAGYFDDNMGTSSRHVGAPLVAVHEFGHSLFDLADEYSSGRGTASYPNCENVGCSKWADLEGLIGSNFCNSGGCQGGEYYTGDANSFMKVLNSNVDHVNNRYSCCTYLIFANSIPTYCDKYNVIGDGLASFCENDYQNYGYPFRDDRLSNSSRLFSEKGKYMKLQKPVTLSIDLNIAVKRYSVDTNALGQHKTKKKYAWSIPENKSYWRIF